MNGCLWIGDQVCPEERDRCPGPGRGEQQWILGMGTGNTRVRDRCVCWGSAEGLRGMGQGRLGVSESLDRDPRTRGKGTRSIPGCGMGARMGTG